MRYIVTSSNPSHSILTGPREDIHLSLSSVRETVQLARKYPGSSEIISVEKENSRGVRKEVEWWNL